MGWGSGVAVSCGVGRRCVSDLTLQWLWCRLAAIALIRPLAWELPFAEGVALKSQKDKKKKDINYGVLVMAQWLTNPTSIHEDAGSILGLAQWVNDPALVWLWRRLAAIAPIRPLAWEDPYAAGAAQEMAKRQKNKKGKK